MRRQLNNYGENVMTNVNNTTSNQIVKATITTTQTWKGQPLTFDFTFDVYPGQAYETALIARNDCKANPCILKYAGTSNIAYEVIG